MDKIIFVNVKVSLDTNFNVSSTSFERQMTRAVVLVPYIYTRKFPTTISRKIRYFPYYSLKLSNFCNFFLHPHPRVPIKSNSDLQFGLINIFFSYFCIF